MFEAPKSIVNLYGSTRTLSCTRTYSSHQLYCRWYQDPVPIFSKTFFIIHSSAGQFWLSALVLDQPTFQHLPPDQPSALMFLASQLPVLSLTFLSRPILTELRVI